MGVSGAGRACWHCDLQRSRGGAALDMVHGHGLQLQLVLHPFERGPRAQIICAVCSTPIGDDTNSEGRSAACSMICALSAPTQCLLVPRAKPLPSAGLPRMCASARCSAARAVVDAALNSKNMKATALRCGPFNCCFRLNGLRTTGFPSRDGQAHCGELAPNQLSPVLGFSRRCYACSFPES